MNKTFNKVTVSKRGVGVYRDGASGGTVYLSSKALLSGFPETFAVEYEATEVIKEKAAGVPKNPEAAAARAEAKAAREELKKAREDAKAKIAAAKQRMAEAKGTPVAPVESAKPTAPPVQ